MAESTSQISMFDVVAIGETAAALRCIPQGGRLRNRVDATPGVLDRLEELLDRLSDLEIAQAAQAARELLRSLIAELSRRVEADGDAMVSEPERAEIHDVAEKIWDKVRSEVGERRVFVPPFDASGFRESFVRDPRPHFGLPGDDPWPRSADAVSDMQECADCYAIERYPGAIVFAYRAAEGLVRQFREIKVTSPPTEQGLTQLFNTLAQQGQCDEATIVALRTLVKPEDGTVPRNEAVHAVPRDPVAWNVVGAGQVIQNCARAIGAMSRELEAIRVAGAMTSHEHGGDAR